MELSEFLAKMPSTFPNLLRELADVLDENKARRTRRKPESPIEERILSVVKPVSKGEGKLLSQAEIMVLLEKAGVRGIGPKHLSQNMKEMGFSYSNASYSKEHGKPKRGFWCEIVN